jgi:flotillin
MRGEIGEKEKQGRTRQEISKIDAATAVLETERQGEKASAEAQLTMKRTELNMNIDLANITAKRIAEQRDTELQKEVETKRAEMELERLRAIDVTKSKIAKETSMLSADAAHYSQVKEADGSAYKVQKEAKAARKQSQTLIITGYVLTYHNRLPRDERG